MAREEEKLAFVEDGGGEGKFSLDRCIWFMHLHSALPLAFIPKTKEEKCPE